MSRESTSFSTSSLQRYISLCKRCSILSRLELIYYTLTSIVLQTLFPCFLFAWPQGEPVDDVQHLVLGWVVAGPSHCTLQVLIGCNAIAMHCCAMCIAIALCEY